MEYTEEKKAEIYEKFGEKVLGYFIMKVNDRYLAEDLTSDTFIKVYEKLDTFDPTKASLSTWIYTIARNTLTDHFRTRHVMEEVPETLADDDSVEDSVISEEMLKILAASLEKLDERERDIVILHYYSGKTLKEIGESLGISYTYVKVLHNKALSQLKKFF